MAGNIHRVYLASTGPFTFDSTDLLPNELTETIRGLRVQDMGLDGETPGDDTVVQPGAPAAANEVLRLGDLAASLALVRNAYGIYLPDQIIVTPTGKDYVLWPGGETANTLTIVGIQAAAESLMGSSGDTTLRISKLAKGGSTADSISLSMGYAEKNKAATGSFEITVGDPIYLYCEDATAMHVGLSVNIIVKGY